MPLCSGLSHRKDVARVEEYLPRQVEALLGAAGDRISSAATRIPRLAFMRAATASRRGPYPSVGAYWRAEAPFLFQDDRRDGGQFLGGKRAPAKATRPRRR